MKVEDITENHIRRQALVRVVDTDGSIITGIPLGFVDKEVRVYEHNVARWHDRSACQGKWFMETLTSALCYIKDCYGECLPSQKPAPWDESKRYCHMLHNCIYKETELRRTVVFTSGREITYVLDSWKEDVGHDS